MEFRRYNYILRSWLPLLLMASIGAAAVTWVYLIQALGTADPWLFSAGVGLCALLWGIGGVLGIEYLTDNVRVWDDVRRITHAPLLSSVRAKHDSKDPFEAGGSDAAAEYRIAGMKLLPGGVSGGRTILVCSPQPTAQTARVAANLATVYAHENLPTLLVDADRMDGTLTMALGLVGVPGFADAVLRPSGDVMLHIVPSVPNLQVLPSGANLQVAPITFSRGSLGKVLAHSGALRSLVVIAGPPVSPSGIMSIGLAKASEDIVLVVVAGETKRKALRRTVTILAEAGTNLVGILFVKPSRFVPGTGRSRRVGSMSESSASGVTIGVPPSVTSPVLSPVAARAYAGPTFQPVPQVAFASQYEGGRSGRFTERVPRRPRPEEDDPISFVEALPPEPPEDEPEKPVRKSAPSPPEPDLSGLENLKSGQRASRNMEEPSTLLDLSELDSLGVELAEDSSRKRVSPLGVAPSPRHLSQDTPADGEISSEGPQEATPSVSLTMPIPYVVNAPKFIRPAEKTSDGHAQASQVSEVLEVTQAVEPAPISDPIVPTQSEAGTLSPAPTAVSPNRSSEFWEEVPLQPSEPEPAAPHPLTVEQAHVDDDVVTEEALNDLTSSFGIDLPPRVRPQEQAPVLQASPVSETPGEMRDPGAPQQVSMQRVQPRDTREQELAPAPPKAKSPRGPGPVDNLLAAAIRWWFSVRTSRLFLPTAWSKVGANARGASRRVGERLQLGGAYLVRAAAVRRRRRAQLKAMDAARTTKPLQLVGSTPGWAIPDSEGMSGDELISLWLRAADRARRAGDHAEAKELINRVLDRDPRNETAWRLRLMLAGRHERQPENQLRPQPPVRKHVRASRRGAQTWIIVLLAIAVLSGALYLSWPQLSSLAGGITPVSGMATSTPDAQPSVAEVTPEPSPVDTPPAVSYEVGGDFLQFWGANGGARILGNPISPRLTEVNEQGTSIDVQYFERARLELQPDAGVSLGRIGTEVPVSGTVANPLPEGLRGEGVTFKETGNTVPARFNAFWQANNGLVLFGYPVTPVLNDVSAVGTPVSVQYFERARFEYHPELAGKEGEVSLTNLGVLDYALRHPGH